MPMAQSVQQPERIRESPKKTSEADLKLNAEKSFVGQTETEYLGFWVSKIGVRYLSSKV